MSDVGGFVVVVSGVGARDDVEHAWVNLDVLFLSRSPHYCLFCWTLQQEEDLFSSQRQARCCCWWVVQPVVSAHVPTPSRVVASPVPLPSELHRLVSRHLSSLLLLLLPLTLGVSVSIVLSLPIPSSSVAQLSLSLVDRVVACLAPVSRALPSPSSAAVLSVLYFQLLMLSLLPSCCLLMSSLSYADQL